MHRIIGALELCCRRGEMLLIQNKRVNWDTCQIGIPGSTTKDRGKPANPIQPQGTAGGSPQTTDGAGPRRIRLRQHERRLPADDSDGLGNIEAPGERHQAEGGRGGSEMEPRTSATRRPAVARPQARGRVSVACRRRRHSDHSADAGPRQHSANATLPERDGRRTSKRIGSELDQPGADRFERFRETESVAIL
jgi:hypothetical protein